MKKSILSIFALGAIFVACSDDDTDPISKPIVKPSTEDFTKLVFNQGTKVDISTWTWKDAKLSNAVSTETLSGKVTTTVTLDATKKYSLPNSYTVEAGGKLIIPAGTQIEASAAEGKDATSIYIAVLKGGVIEINGTADNPVVMSSKEGKPGNWGGLTICGEGITSAGVDKTAEVGGFKYGGTNVADNSGVINYLVIRGTGAQIDTESQYNGVSLYAVGSGTAITNVAIIDGADDGIEFFGGSVSVTNLYLENNEDDAIDWTEKWTGTVTNSYISHTIEDFSTVVEADKDNGEPKLINLTAVSAKGGTALQFKKASGATITNLVLEGYDQEFDVKDPDQFITANVIIDGKTVETKIETVEVK